MLSCSYTFLYVYGPAVAGSPERPERKLRIGAIQSLSTTLLGRLGIKICPVPTCLDSVTVPPPPPRWQLGLAWTKIPPRTPQNRQCRLPKSWFGWSRSAVQPDVEHEHAKGFALSKNWTVQGSKKRTFSTLVKWAVITSDECDNWWICCLAVNYMITAQWNNYQSCKVSSEVSRGESIYCTPLQRDWSTYVRVREQRKETTCLTTSATKAR